jgi:enoyl-CoA hydratase/carnithine racemase
MAPTALSIADSVATLAIDPPVSGYDRALIEWLSQAAAELASRHPELRAVVVAGEGADFGHGWSPDALAANEGIGGLIEPAGAAFEALAAVPQPTVAAIGGRAHSAGLELVLACDIRVAAEGATFAMPETGSGRIPHGGGTQRLPRAVGRAQALRLLLTGEEIDAAEARRIGLVSSVVPDGEEREAAMAIARTIASRGPLATRFAKESVMRGSDLPLDQALQLELELTVLLQTTHDRAEGVRAFVERRDPLFEGR